MGFSLEEINFDNTDSHWRFHTPNGMKFKREKNRYTNKELDLFKIKLYFNSFSECLIPTSLYEQTIDDELSVFSAMDAQEVVNIMNSGFSED